ncbi:unnamed protein product, partial [Polarella glacialis]
VPSADIPSENSIRFDLRGVEHRVVRLQDQEKLSRLSDLLDVLDFRQAVVFVSSSERADRLQRALRGPPSLVVHEGFSAEQQTQRLEQFRNFEKRVLVTTQIDLFNEGICIDKVDAVINYDAPCDSWQYACRVGYSRLDSSGDPQHKGPAPVRAAISFVVGDADEAFLVDAKQKLGLELLELPCVSCEMACSSPPQLSQLAQAL